MNNPFLTIESVSALNPCHSAEKIKAWYPDRTRVRLFTVLRDDRITRADRVWLAVRVLPRPVVQRWLEVVIDRAVRRSVGRSGRPAWEAWAARWLSGADRTRAAVGASEASRASLAACWAAEAAWLSGAARTRAAALAAAAEAARVADAAVTVGAAEAARAAERDQQIADLFEIIAE